MKILITGDRAWTTNAQAEAVHAVFANLILPKYGRETTIIHGYAKGVDTLAMICAEGFGLQAIACPAHWRHNEPKWMEVYGPCPETCLWVTGRPAGIWRNRYMLDTHHPNLVIGFHNNLELSRGTKNMIKIAKSAHIPTLIYTEHLKITT